MNTSAPPSAMGSAEANLLTELVQAIEASDQQITQEVQTVIERAKKPPEVPPVTAKTVRQAFDKLEKKRKMLQQAQQARANLHQSWNQYIEESVKRWKAFATDFANKDAELEKRMAAAKEAVIEAKQRYDTAKEDNDRQDVPHVEEVDDVSDGMDDEPTERMATAEEIQANLTAMVTSMEGLRTRPTADQGEHANKKQKTNSGEEGNPAGPPQPGFGQAALQPFGGPGK